jgi:hypothetical protein
MFAQVLALLRDVSTALGAGVVISDENVPDAFDVLNNPARLACVFIIVAIKRTLSDQIMLNAHDCQFCVRYIAAPRQLVRTIRCCRLSTPLILLLFGWFLMRPGQMPRWFSSRLVV